MTADIPNHLGRGDTSQDVSQSGWEAIFAAKHKVVVTQCVPEVARLNHTKALPAAGAAARLVASPSRSQHSMQHPAGPQTTAQPPGG